jgi:hypothetical protein
VHVSERLKQLPDFDELVTALDLVKVPDQDEKEVQP